ncbi:MAG TPA: GldG family protein [Planctomycetota bacterium]|jgi:ABC-2 type transport system permease protein
MATNKNTRDSVVLAAIVVAAVITVTANLLADRKFGRIDLTSEGKYSVSSSFRNILNRLEDPAILTYYTLTQVPPSFDSRKRDILDKLREIETAAKGKVELQIVDPTTDKELRDRLQKEGFEHDYQEFNKDQLSISKIYSGIEITYQDRPKGKIPGIGDPEQLEYALGSQLVEMTIGKDKKPVIAIMAPTPPPQQPMMGQRPPGTGYEWIAAGQFEDGKKFDIKPVEITEGNNIPPETALLVLVRPKSLNDRQRYEVAKYLASGGKVLLLASPFKIGRDFGWRAEKSPSGLEDYLRECGVTFNDNFVADKSNLEFQLVQMFTGQRTRVRLPFFVKIKAENIDQQSVLTRLMPGLVMPFPSEIKLDKELAAKNGLTASVLAKTSNQSWSVPYSDTFDPDKNGRYDDATQQTDGSKVIFVAMEGQFPFPYEGKPAPAWTGGDKPEDKKDEKKDDKKADTAAIKKAPGRLLICSAPDAFNSTYLMDQNLGRELQSNIFLLANITNTCGLGSDDLINLRVKQYETRGLSGLAGPENDAKRRFTKWMLVGCMPILVAVVALVRMLYRRRTQVRYERQFAQTSGPSSFTP